MVKYGTGSFNFELVYPKPEIIKIIKSLGIKSDKFKDFYFDDYKHELGWKWEGLYQYEKQKSKHTKKSFKIQFEKEKEYLKAKELMLSYLELKGKYYQQIKK